MTHPAKRFGIIGVALLLLAGSALAQNRAPAPAQGAPRTPDGKPNFNGIWQAFGSAHWNIEPHSAIEGRPAGPGIVVGGEIPYQPAAREQQKKNYERRAVEDPVARCFLPGVPRVTYLPFPFEILQTAKHIGIAYEYAHATRTIFLDGTPHVDGLDFWMGDSRGRWEKDTLVVDTISLDGRSWLDHAGNFIGEGARVVERLTPRGPNHIDYEATITNPKVFTRPWQIALVLYRRVEDKMELLDYECVEQFYQKLYEERAKSR